MSLVDVDSWVTEFDSCERLGHTIKSQIVERDQQKGLNSAYSKISANIRIRLRQFENELEQLKYKLNAGYKKGSMTVEEIERRQRQIETLQSTYMQLQNKFKNATTSSENTQRSLLIPIKGSLWEDEEDDEPIVDNSGTFRNQNVQDLRQQQIDMLEDQNRGLDALAATLSRQKVLSSRLGQEVTEQNEILDDLADNMERVDIGVNRETRQIGVVNERDKTCGYWIIIIILFVAICIVALL